MTLPPVLALDVDGVLIEGFPRYRWDENLEANLGIESARMQTEFFEPHWHDIMLGRKPVEPALATFLKNYPSRVDVKTLLAYWHGNDAHLRQDVVSSAIAWQQRTGGKLALATNQDLTRSGYLRETMGLGVHFEIMIVSCEIGAAKPEPTYFALADRLLAREPDQTVIFLDDLEPNVAAANQHGWTAHHVPEISRAAEIIAAL